MPMNDKTGQSKGYAFMSAPKYVCDELLKSKSKTRNPQDSKL